MRHSGQKLQMLQMQSILVLIAQDCTRINTPTEIWIEGIDSHPKQNKEFIQEKIKIKLSPSQLKKILHPEGIMKT